MTVFERIKKLAKSRSKTMKQVTLDLGYSENYFYSLKSGKQPSAEKLAGNSRLLQRICRLSARSYRQQIFKC